MGRFFQRTKQALHLPVPVTSANFCMFRDVFLDGNARLRYDRPDKEGYKMDEIMELLAGLTIDQKKELLAFLQHLSALECTQGPSISSHMEDLKEDE